MLRLIINNIFKQKCLYCGKKIEDEEYEDFCSKGCYIEFLSKFPSYVFNRFYFRKKFSKKPAMKEK